MLSQFREYPITSCATAAYVVVLGTLAGSLDWSAEAVYLGAYASAPIFFGLTFYEDYRHHRQRERDR